MKNILVINGHSRRTVLLPSYGTVADALAEVFATDPKEVRVNGLLIDLSRDKYTKLKSGDMVEISY